MTAGRRRVVVTGAGAISPIENGEVGLEGLWSALAAGRDAFLPIAELQFDRDAEADRLQRATAAGVRFDPRDHLEGNYRPIDRTGQLAIVAAQRALAEAGWTAERRTVQEVGLVLGTMFGSLHTISAFDRRGVEAGPKYVKPLDFANSVINAAAGQAAIWLGLRGPNSTVTGGCVAGLQALAQACELIRSGRSDALLAGGADELAFESFFAFQHAGLLGSADLPRPFDARRDGFVPGEGAAILMLEAEDSATRRGGTTLGILAGHGTAFDPSRGTDRGSLASALTRAVGAALEDAGPSVPIDAVSSGASGLPTGDAAEAAALEQVLNSSSGTTPVTAVKSLLGESLGAAGAFQALVALGIIAGRELPGVAGWHQADPDIPALDLAATPRAIPARRVLLTSVSFDGFACAVVLDRPGDQETPT
ncbi:MAG: hypothetical protein MPN21_14845 [Thermoanaerobaculia bacterium]|nr:hypothetical protein [Thermoanaerobaculia bacterium]